MPVFRFSKRQYAGFMGLNVAYRTFDWIWSTIHHHHHLAAETRENSYSPTTVLEGSYYGRGIHVSVGG